MSSAHLGPTGRRSMSTPHSEQRQSALDNYELSGVDDEHQHFIFIIENTLFSLSKPR